MENAPIFKFGKPSISIRAIYTVAMLVITRGYHILASCGTTMAAVAAMVHSNPMTASLAADLA